MLINFEEYKKRLNLETIKVEKIELDVYFSYNKDFGFQIESVEDVTGAQDLMPLLTDSVIENIENKLHSLYERKGWL
jgi:hypothetical protein